MIFNSLIFVVTFPVIVVLYYAMPQKVKTLFLFIISLVFYACFRFSYVFLLLGVIGISYVSALAMSGKDMKTKKKIVTVDVIASVGVLFLFKYANMFFDSFVFLTDRLGMNLSIKGWNLILPVGISFYIFVALGYLIDVYRGRIEVEKDIIAFGAFISFFPALLSGPIERAENLLKQIKEKKIFSEEKILNGACRMLWGYFQKVVIADRTAVIVNAVYDNDEAYTGIYILMATVLYAFQIYCDFAGCSNLAIGAAGILGFEMRENFKLPYLAVDIGDFWARWHISLSTWLRDYVYISVGGNRRGKIIKYRNLMITFLISGIWHGANWTFVVWGALHGLYNIAHNWLKEKWKPETGKISTSWKVACTFLLVDFAWLFFRASSLSHAFRLLKNMVMNLDIFSLLNREMAISMGMEIADIIVLVIALIILVAVELSAMKVSYRDRIVKAPLLVRWLVFYGVIFAIIIFGYYGPGFEAGQFIYAQF